jgi:hypothetical protein
LSLYLSGVFIGRIGVGLEEKSAAVKIDIFSILTDSSGKPTMRSKKKQLTVGRSEWLFKDRTNNRYFGGVTLSFWPG